LTSENDVIGKDSRAEHAVLCHHLPQPPPGSWLSGVSSRVPSRPQGRGDCSSSTRRKVRVR